MPAGAGAAEPSAAPVAAASDRPAAPDSLRSRMAADPTCRQFDDGCSICRVAGAEAYCSAPAIACIAAGWRCADRSEPDRSAPAETVPNP